VERQKRTPLLPIFQPATILEHTLFLMGEPIEKVSSFKYLGVNIYDDLTWSKHIQTVSSKARRIICMLYRQFYHCTSTPALLHLYKTQIRPHLEYASVVWDPYLAKDIKLLEGVQKFATKVISKNWDTEYSEILYMLDLPELAIRRKISKLTFLFKIVNQLTFFPEAPLTPRTLHYPTRTVHSVPYCQLHGRSYQYLYSFFPHAISLWNNLTSSTLMYTTLIRQCMNILYLVLGCTLFAVCYYVPFVLFVINIK